MMIGAGGGSDSWLLRIVDRIFRCSHRRQSRPITPRGGGQSYAVCLDCGTRLAYDLNAMRVEASVLESSLHRQTSEVGKAKILDIPEPEFISGAPRSWETLPRDSRPFHHDFGTIAVLWIGAMSLAGGLLYLRNRPAGPKNFSTPEQARLLPPGDFVKSSPSLAVGESGTEVVPAPQATALALPTVSTELLSTTGNKAIEPDSTSAWTAPRSDQVLRLDGKGPVIVLGLEAVVALELSRHPERLRKLIQRGSLFTVPRRTAIKLLQGERLGSWPVVKVRIMEGPRVGQEGWAQP
jgi:hypothetical protein